MLDRSAVEELMALAEKNLVCSEAIELLEKCLAERSPALFEAFMQRQMLNSPAQIDVFLELAETVHQHMIALQESLFEIRTGMLNRLKDHFQIDITPLVPLDLIEEYHALELDEALAFVTHRYTHLSENELIIVCHTMHNAVLRAGQVTQSLLMVRHILEYMFDWLEALSVFVVKAYWHWQSDLSQSRQALLH
ncbi:MAG: hypothetical protein GC179_19435 [Anaerolineaceae bacterium]|nr:hypothetical protein [Anaerolineaceae bacterium]